MPEVAASMLPTLTTTRATKPLHPYVVLLAALLLPGFGYVLNGQMRRGLTMQMFMVALAFVTWHLAPESASFIGKLAGGIFVYALTIPESYGRARMRWIAAQSKSGG